MRVKVGLLTHLSRSLTRSAQSIESAIGANAFQHSKVNAWTSNIVVRTPARAFALPKVPVSR